MTLLKLKWRTMAMMMIAVGLMLAGGAWAATAPTLGTVTVDRTNATTGTITFTPTGEGKIYYKVVAASGTATDADIKAETGTAITIAAGDVGNSTTKNVTITSGDGTLTYKLYYLTWKDNSGSDVWGTSANTTIPVVPAAPLTVSDWTTPLRVSATTGTGVITYTGTAGSVWYNTKATTASGTNASDWVEVKASAVPATGSALTVTIPALATTVWISYGATSAAAVTNAATLNKLITIPRMYSQPTTAATTNDIFIGTPGNLATGTRAGIITFGAESKEYSSTGVSVTAPSIEIINSTLGGSASDWKYYKVEYRTTSTSGTVVAWYGDDNASIGFNGAGSAKGKDLGVIGANTYYVRAYFKNTKDGPQKDLTAEANKVFTVTAKSVNSLTIDVKLANAEKAYSGAAKDPIVTVKDKSTLDGTRGSGTDYKYDPTTGSDWIAAGTQKVTITGQGNYSGTRDVSFTIEQAPLTIVSGATDYTITKVFDGTTKVVPADEAGQTVKFEGFQLSSEALALGTDYRWTTLPTYDSKAVGDNRIVTGTVALIANGTVAKNYKLASTSAGNFKVSGQSITKGTVKPEFFTTTPAWNKTDEDGTKLYEVYYKGPTTKVSMTAAFASAYSNGSGTQGAVKVSYSGLDEGETAPVRENSYDVYVTTNEGTSFLAQEEPLKIGVIRIQPARNPLIADIADASYRIGSSYTLKVVATNPNGSLEKPATSGLKYKWYYKNEAGDTIPAKNGGSASLSLKGSAVGDTTYVVLVTYTNTSEQASTYALSNEVKVSVLAAPEDISPAEVFVDDEFTYTGSEMEITSSQVRVVLNRVTTLEAEKDFTVKFSNIINAGTNSGIIKVTGVDAYKGTATGTFSIKKKDLEQTDYSVTTSARYNGKEQGMTLKLASKYKTTVTLTPVYTAVAPTTESTPKNAGSWTVNGTIKGGDNFNDVTDPIDLGTFSITKYITTLEDVEFKIPTDHKWTGAAQGIGAVTLKNVAAEYAGEKEIRYTAGGTTVTAAVDSGVYAVSLYIKGNDNFNVADIPLGTYEIHGATWVSVAESNREIPGKAAVVEAAVAPVKAVVASVSVGPNPVASSGKVTFFWNGSSQVTGKLIVFTNVGRKVASINVKGVREIGAWNVNGAAEGTYLVKGVLTEKNGGKVNVSTVVSVAK